MMCPTFASPCIGQPSTTARAARKPSSASWSPAEVAAALPLPSLSSPTSFCSAAVFVAAAAAAAAAAVAAPAAGVAVVSFFAEAADVGAAILRSGGGRVIDAAGPNSAAAAAAAAAVSAASRECEGDRVKTERRKWFQDSTALVPNHIDNDAFL